MQNRSDFSILEENHTMPADFRVIFMEYTQFYEEVTHFHYHNCMEIGHCVKGEGLLFIEGKVYPFYPDSITVIPQGCVHDAHILMSPDDMPSEWEYIFVDLESVKVLNPMAHSDMFRSRTLSDLYRIAIHVLVEQKLPGWKDEFRQLISVFLIEADKRKSNSPGETEHKADEVILQALHKISRDYAQDLSVEDLARYSNMSVSYFRKRFTENVGMSPKQYLIHVRLILAERQIRTTDKPILSISQDVGFNTLSSFNRLFHKAYGCPPSAIRE